MHVDELLDALTPEEFAERWARQRIDGVGEEWRRTATLAAEIYNGFLLLIEMTKGANLSKYHRTPEHWVPGEKPQDHKPVLLTPEESEARAKARYG